MSLRLAVEPLSLPLRAPLATAHGEIRSREGWLVQVEADGLAGWGEALPLPDFGTESHRACEDALRAATDRIRSLPSDLSAVDLALVGLEKTPAARFALETALLDWLARRGGVSLANLLGEPHTRSIAVNALLGGATVEVLVEQARAARAAGFGTVKVKVAGRPVAEDVARVFAVREAIGPSLRLRIDANGGWSLAEAIEALERLAPAQLEVCEQPTPADELTALAKVRAAKRCPIAADEALLTPGGPEAVIEAGACDVLVLKPMALGGVRRTLEIAERARPVGLDVYVTSLIDGEIARAAAAQLAALIPSQHAHGLATGALLAQEPRTHWLLPEAGRISLPDLPGLGVEAVR